MTSPPEAPPAPTEQQAPAAPAPQPPAPPQQEAPRVPPGQPGAGQFAQQQQAQPPAQPPAPPAQPAAPETDWRAEAERYRLEAEEARAEATRHKRQARNQEQRSKANHAQVNQQEAVLRLIAEKVGVEYDDRPDPEVLTQRLDQVSTIARQRAIELGVLRLAVESGVNVPAILDSREFMTQAEQLDPDASDFTDQVRDLVKAAAGQPRYQFQQPPVPAPPEPPAQPLGQQQPAQPPPPQPPAPSSGSDFSGAPSDGFFWTQADYDHWTAPGMDRDGTIMTKAIAEGRLANLGVGKPKTRGRR